MVLGIHGIEESSVYQDIFSKGEAKGRAEGEGEAQGRAEEARKILLRQGRKRLGAPDESVLDRIAALSDPDRLDLLLDRLLDVSSWDELLASAGVMTPSRGRDRRRSSRPGSSGWRDDEDRRTEPAPTARSRAETRLRLDFSAAPASCGPSPSPGRACRLRR